MIESTQKSNLDARTAQIGLAIVLSVTLAGGVTGKTATEKDEVVTRMVKVAEDLLDAAGYEIVEKAKGTA